jgi:hypothetical protein
MPSSIVKSFLLLLYCLHPLFIFSQHATPPEAVPDTSGIRYSPVADLPAFSPFRVDTSLNMFQRYNPLEKNRSFMSHLGNLGLPSQPLIFRPNRSQGFHLRQRPSNNYLFYEDSIRIYSNRKPFTEIFYVFGAKKEQMLAASHSQAVKNTAFGADFRIINAPGFYKRQESDIKNLEAYFSYKTRNDRYNIIASYMHNKLVFEENGGIKSDSIFENNLEKNRKLIDVKLAEAQNTLRDDVYILKNLFRPGTLKTDSSHLGKQGFFENILLSHIALLSRQAGIYQDGIADSSFYTVTYNHAQPTYDSLFLFKIENRFYISNLPGASSTKLRVRAGMNHQYIEFNDPSGRSFFHLITPSLEGRYTLNKSVDLNLLLHQTSSPESHFNKDFDIQVKTAVNLRLGCFVPELVLASKAAPWMMNTYTSNHFRWDYSFDKEKYLSFILTYRYQKLTLTLAHHQVENYLYFNAAALPEAETGRTSIYQVILEKDFSLSHVEWHNLVVYQDVYRGEALRLPALMARMSVFYDNMVFNKAARLQAGIDVFYQTEYYADSYMPATSVFFIQNLRKTGDFTYPDVFFNLQIKRARLFLKYHNLMYLARKFDYFLVPGYPLYDGGFKFGVSWMFYD